MKTENFAELKSRGGVQPVFQGLKVEAELRETLSITTITQTYHNPGSKNIEAVYTFPLPLDAVLLSMEVTLGKKTLIGKVLPKKNAEKRYEDAITDGDAPVMLQNPQPGLYTMNVGNLLPMEKVRIAIKYATFLRWQGDTLRYHLPTTIAPRYGSPVRAGLEPHQEPVSSITVDNFFSFQMQISGDMAGRLIESPCHDIAITHTEISRKSIVSFAQKEMYMDRDLIITVKNTSSQASSITMGRDGDTYLLWGSFKTQFGLSDNLAPRSVKIVVDCSGSMEGDSIAQAREALIRVLDELRPHDWFNIVFFGSTATPLFNAQKRAVPEALSYARGFLKEMDANMGGTEIGNAMRMAVRLRCPEKIEQDVLLITDGEIWEWETLVEKAVKSNHRFFSIGVGSAVSEAFVRTLAERTGGACELVSPNENMAERIHRHFKRISTPRSSGTGITWPINPTRVFPAALPCIYDGDTVNIFAWFDEPPTGEVLLEVKLPDGSKQILTAIVEPRADKSDSDDTLARMAAAYKLREIYEEKTGQKLAVLYQLISRWTNYIAVVVRDEDGKAATLPDLEKIPQMLAAGWGGFGIAMRSARCSPGYDAPTFQRDRSKTSNVSRSRPIVSFTDNDEDQLIKTEPSRWVVNFVTYLDNGIIPVKVGDLRFPIDSFTLKLEELKNEFGDEKTLIVIFLKCLAETPLGERMTKRAKRVISKAFKTLTINVTLAQTINDRFVAVLNELEIGEILKAHPVEYVTVAEEGEHIAKIKVIGVGCGGNNAVESMIASTMQNVDFIIANTDSKSLRATKAKTKIQLGSQLTRGLGTGTRPEIGREAALESRSQLIECLKGTDLLFIAAGMGGGTGTGASPIIAEVAREAGVLTVGIVTKPFTYEGKMKTKIADMGLLELRKCVDSLIVVSNDSLICHASKGISLVDAFKPADDVLRQAVQCISELILATGDMSLDFADVKTVMSVRGMAMMGIGIGTGEDKASKAIHMAISSPLMEDHDISSAKDVLINITGSSSSMFIDDYTIVNRIVSERVHENANIQIGVVQDDSIGDIIKVTVIATGFRREL